MSISGRASIGRGSGGAGYSGASMSIGGRADEHQRADEHHISIGGPMSISRPEGPDDLRASG